MNSMLLIFTLGSLSANSIPAQLVAPGELAQVSPPPSRQTGSFVYQREVDWPKRDPRDPQKPSARGGVPAIGKSQLQQQVPEYTERRPTNQPVGRLTTPTDESFVDDGDSTTAAQAPSSRGGSRYSREDDQPEPITNSRFPQTPSRQFREEEPDFAPSPTLRTSVRRQGGQSREFAPNPLEIRSAAASDDEDEDLRTPPPRSYSIAANLREDDLGAGEDAYEGSSRPLRDDGEVISSRRGDLRNTRHSAEDEGDSILQGGKKVPETNSNTMWVVAVVSFLLFASIGANFYLAWVAREFYERYRSLAQQVRAARNNLT
jgi:hypothetical protein